MNIVEIKKIANLARIEIQEDKISSFTEEFTKILEYFEKLDHAPTAGVEPFSFAEENVFREDHPVPSSDDEVRNMILKNAPLRQDDFFKVKKVIEE